MEQVIYRLIQEYPLGRIFLFGRGEEEEKYFQLWCAQYRQCTWVGKHCEGMYQELILMSHLNVMLSMDSANMHLASLTGIPVVSVWGATHPMGGFLGFNQNADNVIQLDLECRPCSIYGNKPCQRGDYACLQNIPPERIVERITTLINN
jgi:ADP-heptose:LPS heptosyltransferase